MHRGQFIEGYALSASPWSKNWHKSHADPDPFPNATVSSFRDAKTASLSQESEWSCAPHPLYLFGGKCVGTPAATQSNPRF